MLLSQGPIGQAIPSAKLTVAQYLHQWLDAMEDRVQPTTMRTYRFAIDRYIIPYLGQLSLLRMTAPAIEAWLSQLHKQSLSPATVHQAHRVLREALVHAVRWMMLSRSPMAVVQAPKMGGREMKVWDEEQVRLFIAEAKRSSEYYSLYLMAC